MAFTLDKLGIYFADFNFRGSLPTAKFRENWTTRKFSIFRYNIPIAIKTVSITFRVAVCIDAL